MTDRAVITSPCVGGESLRRRRSWDYWRFYGGETALQSRHGSPCSALLRVDDGSDWSFENKRSGAIHVSAAELTSSEPTVSPSRGAD